MLSECRGRNTPETYALRPQLPPYVLIILHDAGYATIDDDTFEEGAETTLDRWGRVEGVARIGTEPARHAKLTLNPCLIHEQDAPQHHWYYAATSNEAGQLVFKSVIAGRASVARMIQEGRMSRLLRRNA